MSGNLCDLVRSCVCIQGRRVCDLKIVPVGVSPVVHLSHTEAFGKLKHYTESERTFELNLLANFGISQCLVLTDHE